MSVEVIEQIWVSVLVQWEYKNKRLYPIGLAHSFITQSYTAQVSREMVQLEHTIYVVEYHTELHREDWCNVRRCASNQYTKGE